MNKNGNAKGGYNTSVLPLRLYGKAEEMTVFSPGMIGCMKGKAATGHVCTYGNVADAALNQTCGSMRDGC